MPTPFGTSQVTSCGFWHRLHRIPWLSVHLGLNKLCSYAFQLEAKPLGDRSLARAVINGRGALSSGFTCRRRRRRRSPLSHPSVRLVFFLHRFGTGGGGGCARVKWAGTAGVKCAVCGMKYARQEEEGAAEPPQQGWQCILLVDRAPKINRPSKTSKDPSQE